MAIGYPFDALAIWLAILQDELQIPAFSNDKHCSSNNRSMIIIMFNKISARAFNTLESTESVAYGSRLEAQLKVIIRWKQNLMTIFRWPRSCWFRVNHLLKNQTHRAHVSQMLKPGAEDRVQNLSNHPVDRGKNLTESHWKMSNLAEHGNSKASNLRRTGVNRWIKNQQNWINQNQLYLPMKCRRKPSTGFVKLI